MAMGSGGSGGSGAGGWRRRRRWKWLMSSLVAAAEQGVDVNKQTEGSG